MPLSQTETSTQPSPAARESTTMRGATPGATYFIALPIRLSSTCRTSTRSAQTSCISPVTMVAPPWGRSRVAVMCLTRLPSGISSHCRVWSRATAWASRSLIRVRIWATLVRMCCTIGAAEPARGLSLATRSSSSASAQPSITLSGLFRSWATVPAKATSDSRWVAAR